MPVVKRMLDLTQDLYHQCPGLPDFPAPEIKLLLKGPKDGWTLETISMTLHWGTHMDASSHLSPYTGTIDRIPVMDLQGPAVAVDCFGKAPGEPITLADLEPYADRIRPGTIVLLCSGWGEKAEWSQEYVYQSPWLHPAAAEWLVGRGIKGVGIDHFSIGGTVAENEATHRALLSRDVWIAEGLLLPRELCDGAAWHVLCLPLKIRGATGGQARCVAIEYAE